MKRILATLAAASLALAGCSSPDNSITLGLTFIPNVQFAPIYVAEHEGYFEDAGLDVEIRHHGSQESLLGAVQSGEEDIVFAGGDEMLQGRAAGTDIVNWATMYQQYPVTLLVPADSDIESPADLGGRTVGLPGPYGENYFGLLAMLRDTGLDDSDVDVQYVGYTQAAALSSGDVDAIIGFSNSDLVSIAATFGADMDGDPAEWPVRSIDLVDGDLPLVGVGLGSLQGTLDEHSEDFQKLLGAIEKGVEFSQENPEETLDIVATYVPDLAEPENRPAAAATLQHTLELYTGGERFGAQDPDAWNAMADFMWDNELLEEQVPASDGFVDLSAE
ncbi:MAG: ABC transporter substrate-binding protein [Ancrocorticia sp.]|uniref:ABC transporter substrate-binding protein n=1 Tax=Ancrocorticia sp. TaxID=2593684 RepID=UPI003F8F38BB